MSNDDVKPPANIDRLMAWWSLRQWAKNHLPRDAFADFLKLTKRDLQQYLNPFPVTHIYDSESRRAFRTHDSAPPPAFQDNLMALIAALIRGYDFDLTAQEWEEATRHIAWISEAAIRHPGPDPAKTRAATRIFRDYLAQGGDPMLSLNKAARAAGFVISNRNDTFTKDGESYSRPIVTAAWRAAVNG